MRRDTFWTHGKGCFRSLRPDHVMLHFRCSGYIPHVIPGPGDLCVYDFSYKAPSAWTEPISGTVAMSPLKPLARWMIIKYGGWGREGPEFGVSRCKLVYIGWINNKVLLCGTGNYIQYPVINQNGKNMKKNAYICITESLGCTAEINTTF